MWGMGNERTRMLGLSITQRCLYLLVICSQRGILANKRGYIRGLIVWIVEWAREPWMHIVTMQIVKIRTKQPFKCWFSHLGFQGKISTFIMTYTMSNIVDFILHKCMVHSQNSLCEIWLFIWSKMQSLPYVVNLVTISIQWIFDCCFNNKDPHQLLTFIDMFNEYLWAIQAMSNYFWLNPPLVNDPNNNNNYGPSSVQ